MNMVYVKYTYYESLTSCGVNSYLSGYIITESILPTWFQCLTLCLISNICRSVNIWQNLNNVKCQLNWANTTGCEYLDTASDVRYLPVQLTYTQNKKLVKVGQSWSKLVALGHRAKLVTNGQVTNYELYVQLVT